MTTKQITTAVILAQNREKANGTYPVKLRVTYDRKNYKYGTVVSLSKDDFDKATGKNTRAEHKKNKLKLEAIEARAVSIISELPEFTFKAFGDKWYNMTPATQGDPKDVFFAFELVIKDMERQNRIGNADAYKFAKKSLKHFTQTETLHFDKITVSFLKDYEAAMTSGTKDKKGNSLTTVGYYMRCLRAVYNTAIATGVVRPDLYPFGTMKNGKYAIPSPRNIKKALPLQEIKKIFDYTPVSDAESMYRDLWIFSYLCNGANMKDVCLLKYSDISRDTITFRRAKTSNTNRDTKPITAAYTDKLRGIVERWGNTPEPTAFVFPFLQHSDSQRDIKNKGNQVIKMVNKYINRIAKVVEIPGHITTYTARHSYATTLKNAGVNVSFISESMGHSDIKTTESYLGSIEDDQRDEIAGFLTKFDK